MHLQEIGDIVIMIVQYPVVTALWLCACKKARHEFQHRPIGHFDQVNASGFQWLEKTAG